MNKTIIGILSFAAGAVIGAITGIEISRKTFQKQCNEMVNEARNYYKEEIKKAKVATQVIGESYIEKVYGYKNPEERNREPFIPPEPIEYHKIFSQHLQTKPERYLEDLLEQPDIDPEEDMHPEDTDHVELPDAPETPSEDPSPYIISWTEYSIDSGIYTKDCLTYWTVDGILTDNNDEIVDTELVGESNLQELRKPDVDEIYVRNVECGMEWEIEKINRSFSDYLEGIEGSPNDE